MRVEFACGARALECLHASYRQVTRVARELTVGTDEVFETMIRLRDDEVRARKELGKAQRAIRKFEASELLDQAKHVGTNPVVCRQFTDRDGSELHELTRSLSELGAHVILGTTGKTAQIFVARPEAMTLDCGTLLKERLGELGGRGGGRPEMARGGLPNEQLTRAIQSLETEVIREIESGSRSPSE